MGRARIHFRGSWPIQGPFQPKKIAPALKYDFLPKPWKIQTLAITNPLRQTRGNTLNLRGPARSHCSHGRFDTWADVVRPTVPKLQPFSWNNFSKASSVERQLMVNRSPKNDSGSISRLLVVRSARYRSLNGQNQKIKNQNFWSKKWKKMKFVSYPRSASMLG